MLKVSVSTAIECSHYTDLHTASQQDSRRRIHGHSYICRLWVSNDKPNEKGVLVDLDVLKESLCRLCAPFNHSILNEHPSLSHGTMEELALYLFQEISRIHKDVIQVDIERPTLGYIATATRDDS